MVTDAYYVLEFLLCVNSLNSNTTPAMLVFVASPFYRVETQIRLTNLPKVKAPVLKFKFNPRQSGSRGPALNQYAIH